MSVQISYKKQFTLGLLLLLVILVAVEGISRAWWYNIETCAFEQSDVYADLPPEKKRQMCIQTYEVQYSVSNIDPNQHFSTININTEGFRGKDISPLKPDDTFRVFVIGGSTSGDIANTVNTIETITFSTTGDATDFGDLVTLNRSGSANASSHAAVQNETGFAPAAMGLLVGTGPTGSQTTIQYLDIATTGSYAMFGDIHVGADYDQANGTIANATRGVFAEGATGNTYYYSTFSTKGKTTDFGDHATNSFRGIATSNGTRGLRGGGFNGSAYQNNIEYITIASTGNGTDFGDLSAVTQYGAAASSTTRSVFHLGGTGGSGTTAVNTLEYVTIGSTGDTTDFGDLSSARDETAAVNSSTRGVFGGGDTGSASDIMDYITLASTGNATDFGDLTQARDRLSGVCSTTRGIFTDGDSSNYVDYITIASTGDATDFGTPLTTTYRGTGSSNSHGGIS